MSLNIFAEPLLFTIVGLVGDVCYVIAYCGVQLFGMRPQDRWYFWLNVVGPLCILFSLLDAFNMASAIAQSVWFLLTLVSGIRAFLVRRRERRLSPLSFADQGQTEVN